MARGCRQSASSQANTTEGFGAGIVVYRYCAAFVVVVVCVAVARCRIGKRQVLEKERQSVGQSATSRRGWPHESGSKRRC
jgi:hypothetical protein